MDKMNPSAKFSKIMKEIWRIVPDTDPQEENTVRLSFTYLHGKLEEDCKYDCYDLADCPSLNKETLVKGMYPCHYKGNPCTLFYWKRRHNDAINGGLVVYNDDTEAFEYAKKCYDNNETAI